MLAPVGVLLLSFPLTWLLVGLSRRYALWRSMLDVPGSRTSHATPTPRGGGAGMALVLLPGIGGACALGWISARVAIGLAGGGTLISAVGWIDDHRSLSPFVRVIVHLVAAAWLVFWIGGVGGVRLDASTALPGTLVWDAVAVLALAWCINLYNFMDGIDGLAATEAVLVGSSAGLLLLGGGSSLGWLALQIAIVSAAFLLWNRPPARIFMGDVGSGLLGFLLGGLALLAARDASLPVPVWCILLGMFLFDATVTFVRRLLRGERWYSAHRAHAYQRLVQSGWSHGRTTTAVALLDVVLIALALAAARYDAVVWPATLAALGLLALAYTVVERIRPMPGPMVEPADVEI